MLNRCIALSAVSMIIMTANSTLSANKTDGKSEAKTQYRILSIDGGGMRGIMPAMFMEELSRRTGQAPHEMFDLIAGTSIGGILALGYATGDKNPNEFVKLFERNGKNIFHVSTRRRISTGFGILDSKYSAAQLETTLKKYLGEDRYLSDITKTDAMVVSHDAETDHPAVFKTWAAKESESHDLKIWEAARGSSAAPTYFEPFRVSYRDGSIHTLLDGGLSLNNPAMCAYTEMVHLHKDLIYEPSHHGSKKASKAGVEFLVVSLGTGSFTQTLRYEDIKSQSAMSWLNPILHIAMDTKATDYHMSCLLPQENYFRWNPPISDDISLLDDTRPTTIAALKSCASRALEAYEPQMQALVEELTMPSTPRSPRKEARSSERTLSKFASLKNIFTPRRGATAKPSVEEAHESELDAIQVRRRQSGPLDQPPESRGRKSLVKYETLDDDLS